MDQQDIIVAQDQRPHRADIRTRRQFFRQIRAKLQRRAKPSLTPSAEGVVSG